MVDVPTYRILLVRPSALGDVARTVPALTSLHRHFPGAKIDWLVQDTFADVIRHHPDLGEVVPFPRASLRGFGWSASATARGRKFLNSLRDRSYDMVYDLQGLARSGWMTWWTGATRRVGPADARECGWLGYNRRVAIPDIEEMPHTVDRMLAVLAGENIEPERDMTLYVGRAERLWAEKWMNDNELTYGRFAVIAPTARWKSKAWPIERFDVIANRLGEVGMQACVIIGGPAERDQTGLLTRRDSMSRIGPKRIDLVGRTRVGQMMGLIESCGLVVANDSAALHIAVGLGKRAVSVFGPTDSSRVGPYRYDVGTVCAPAESRVNYRTARDDQTVISRVRVEQVWQAVCRVMREEPPRTRHND